MAKESLYVYVDNLRKRLNIKDSDYPINTISICKGKNIFIDFKQFNTSQFCALAFKGDTQDTIILNLARNNLENIFDCGHEMIHLTRHRNIGTSCFNCFETTRPAQNSFIEWEANEGSAEFLVPYKLLLPEIKKLYCNNCSWTDIRKMKCILTKKFNVTEAVIQYRFESLKYEISQYINGTNIDEIDILSASRQKYYGISVASINDTEKKLLNFELNKRKKDAFDIFAT